MSLLDGVIKGVITLGVKSMANKMMIARQERKLLEKEAEATKAATSETEKNKSEVDTQRQTGNRLSP